jgi:hypothetical protein
MGQSQSQGQGQGQSQIVKEEIIKDVKTKGVFNEETFLQQQIRQLNDQRKLVERIEKDVPTSKSQIKLMAEIIEKYKEHPKKNVKLSGKYDAQGNLIIN